MPFCASTCDFCAFYQTEPTAESVRAYLRGVSGEAALAAWPAPATTVFWGGGTPGLLSPRHLEELAGVVAARTGGGAVEWTVELAPGSVTRERLEVLRGAGVTRVSLGVQSFQPARLDALGRRHTREQVYRAHNLVREAGFGSVNLDLMFALPGQEAGDWASDLRAAVELEPDHVSTYCLTFEEDTAMWVRLSQGMHKLDPEREADFYEATWDFLGAAGYNQYEVSNFARPGHECLHNVNTWRMGEWVGLGPSAASQHGGWRGANVADLEKWGAGVARGERMTEDRVPLTQALMAEDALIFGLRMNAGVDVDAWRARCPDAPWDAIAARLEGLAGDGLVERSGGLARLTRRGRLLADSVGEELMAPVL